MRTIEEIDALIKKTELQLSFLNAERREVINWTGDNKRVTVQLPDGTTGKRPVDYTSPCGRRYPETYGEERLIMAPGRLPQIILIDGE